MSTTVGIEAIAFKPIEGGYLYQAPNPWLFGPSRRYIVNEAQKAELLAIIVPRRPLWIALYTAGIIAWTVLVSAIWSISIHHPQPTVLDMLVVGVGTLVPIYVATVVLLQRHLRHLNPILSGAVPSRERFARRDRWNAMADALSYKMLGLLFLMFSFAATTQITSLVIRNSRYPLFSDPTSWVSAFSAALMTVLAALYLTAIIRKHRRARSASR